MTLTTVAAILTITLLFIILKYFEKFNIDNFQGLTINYVTAGTCYYLYSQTSFTEFKNSAAIFFPYYLLMGFLFISVFYLTALSSQHNGVSVATVASKMSMVIPVIGAVFLYSEDLNIYKITGLLLALFSVYLTSTGDSASLKNKLSLPLLLFIGAGLVDSSIKYAQHTVTSAIGSFFSLVFFSAFIIGVLVITFRWFKNNVALNFKNIFAGIILGVSNFASLYYMIGALSEQNADSGKVFIEVNCGVILCSVFFSAVLFREKLTLRGITGVLIAVVAILILSLHV